MRCSHSRITLSDVSPAKKPGTQTTGSPVPRVTPTPRNTGSTRRRASSACQRNSATGRPSQCRRGPRSGGGGVGSKEGMVPAVIRGRPYPEGRFGHASADTSTPVSDLDQLVSGRHADPHSLLGAHPFNGGVVVRAYRPSAESVTVRPLDGSPAVDAELVHPAGVFEAEVPKADLPLAYELEVAYPDGNTFTLRDPYSFLPTIGELDTYLAGEGRHERLYDALGAHVREVDDVTGVAFAVWAPSARSVSVVGDFNSWDGRLHPMRSLGVSGIWELFVPDVPAGARYKYELRTQEGELRLKADPLAQEAELPPQTASVVHRSQYRWQDDEWLERRASADQLAQPMSIYEVHLGSWRLNPLEGNRSLNYLELADELAAYARDMGFTHIELLPVMAHPFAGSWGYQVTGYFAPTPRFGTPDDFKEFVDRLHSHGLGVILDWVPAHFPRDDFALARFDGTALYEHADPRRGAHPD